MIQPRPFPLALIAKVVQSWRLAPCVELLQSVRFDPATKEVAIRAVYNDGRDELTILEPAPSLDGGVVS